jgi:hypothetical protein
LVDSENGGSQSIHVALTVESPILTPSSRSVSFGLAEGDEGPQAPASLSITNTGSGTISSLGEVTLGALQPAAAWLSVALGDHEVLLALTSQASSLKEGQYSTRLPIQSTYGGGDTVDVVLSVSRDTDDPILSLSGTDVVFTGIQGEPSPQSQQIQITNAGGGALGALTLGAPAYQGEVGWLSASLADSTVTLSVSTGSLPGGSHVATVQVGSAEGGSESIEVTFGVGVPVLTASATSASFSAPAGGPVPASKQITLSNTGSGSFGSLGTITYGPPTDPSWLSASRSGPTLTLTVTSVPATPGSYTSDVPVRSGTGGDLTIRVLLTVVRGAEAPDLEVSRSAVRMDAIVGGADPPDQTVLVSNSGGGDLGALGVSEAAGWLSTSGPGSSVTLSASTSGLGEGTYSADVTFTSANGGDETVAVTLEVGEPFLSLSSESASFGAVEGGSSSPPSIDIIASNSGAGDFGSLGTVDHGFGGGGWLDVGSSGGGTTFTLTPSAAGLSVGTHSETVPITSDFGGDVDVEVTITITPPPQDSKLVLSSSAFGFFAEEGGVDPASQWLSVSNGGGGGFGDLEPLVLGSVDYGSGPSGWLTPVVDGEAVRLDVETGTIPDGNHSGEFSVTSAGGDSETVTVTFHVEETLGSTNLELGANSVDFTAVSGSDDPPQRTVAILNGGSGSLADVDVGPINYGGGATGWLSDTQHTDTEVTLIPRTGTLAPGTYSASVHVTSSNGGAETISVSFTLGSSTLTLEARSVSFSASEGGSDPPDQTIEISNSGEGVYGDLGIVDTGTVVYSPSVSSWLTPSVATGTLTLEVNTGSLSAGLYRATVPVTSTLGGSESVSVFFTVRRPEDQPELVVSPSSIRMDAILGAGDPPDQIVLLSNSGGGDLGAIDAEETATWLTTSPSSPVSEFTLSASVTSLTAGTYSTTVDVTSASGGTEEVDVTLVVAAPVLTLSSQGVSFTGSSGGSPATQTVTLSNTGAGTLANLGDVEIGAISYGSGASGWISSPASGSSVVGGSFTIGVSLSGLNPGTYSASFPVTSVNGGSQDVSVSVSVVRDTDPPVLALSTSTQRFGALVGGADPEEQLVYVSNSGGGTLGTIQVGPPNYGTGAPGWLNATLNGSVITVAVASRALDKGTYSARLPIASSNGGSEEVLVTLVVGSPRLTATPRRVSFGDTVKGTGPQPATVILANTGGGTLASLGVVSLTETSYGSGASGWLVPNLVGTSLTLTAQTGNLSARPQPYEARVEVGSEYGGFDTVGVSFTVAPGASPPRLVLSVDSLFFDGIVGGAAPAPQVVPAYNGGGGDLGLLEIGEVTYLDSSGGWLTHSVEGTTIEIQPNPAGLSGGVHEATVEVRSEKGGSGLLAIQLDLAQPILSLSTNTVTFSDTLSSPDTLRSRIFVSNTGGGNRQSLGTLTIRPISYLQGDSGWLTSEPTPGQTFAGNLVELKASASGLPEGTSEAEVRVESQWGGAETVRVSFSARKPDRSFDLPTIEYVQEVEESGGTVLIPLPGDSLVATVQSGSAVEIGLRVGVRNGSETRVTLSGLRVGVPSYAAGQESGWITGAFLDKTTATFTDPAELSIAVDPRGLANGRYEASLVVNSESAGLEEVEPRTLRVILRVG